MDDPLNSLISDDFFASFAGISMPASLLRAFNRSEYVKDVKRRLISGEITEAMIKAFVDEKIKELKAGEYFRFDPSMAALAAALRHRKTHFAEEYLTDLANLKLAEMPMSIRVARECLKERMNLERERLNRARTRVFHWWQGKPDWWFG
jgi:hypothetical protein